MKLCWSCEVAALAAGVTLSHGFVAHPPLTSHRSRSAASTSTWWLSTVPSVDTFSYMNDTKDTRNSTNTAPAPSSDETPRNNDPDHDQDDDEERPGLPTDRTLYEILGASPDDTREVIKKKYVYMAKQTHPDTLVGSGSTSSEIAQKEDAFREIAAAWRVLGNSKERLRYDRSLKAKAFTENVERFAENGFRNMVPFFRNTSQSTRSVVSGSQQEVKKAFENVGQRMGRVIDRLTLLRKSNDLEERAYREGERANQIISQLEAVANKRIQMVLRTPNSKLSSDEAIRILDQVNEQDAMTLVDRIKENDPIVSYIQDLELYETQVQSMEQAKEAETRKVAEVDSACNEAQAKLNEAKEREMELRWELAAAQQKVMEAHQQVDFLAQTKARAERDDREVGRQLNQMWLGEERRQERLRVALRQRLMSDSTGDPFSLSDIELLRKEENILASESEKLQDRARRLQSRAEKLRTRAELLRREQGGETGRNTSHT